MILIYLFLLKSRRLLESGMGIGGNNGLKSTIASLSTEDFPRLRIGTDSASRVGSNLKTGSDSDGKISDIDFVLSKFTAEEKEKLPDLLCPVVSEIDNWLGI